MRQAVTKDLYAYWNRLRGARAAPDRSDIDPAAIRHVLADTFIIETDPRPDFPIRLSGARLNAMWLSDQKGRPFLELWREADRSGVAAAISTVIDGVTPIVGGVCAKTLWEPPVDLELLLLPLRHFGKTHSRVLGSLAPSYQAKWLGLVEAEPLELKSLRVINTAETRASPRPHEFATAWQIQDRKAPRLVVYEGGKT
jgi:hypothetical protein